MSRFRVDLPAGLRLDLVDPSPAERAAVQRQLGLPARELGVEDASPAGSPPDLPSHLTVRFVERLATAGRLRFLGRDEAAFDEEAFYVLRGRFKSVTRVRVPFERIGRDDGTAELVCERGLAAVPLLVPLLNLTALARGVLPLHASAFVHRGTGCLCTGWSKGGKTEALLAFTDQGAAYVGDEWVYLPPGGERLCGLPEPVRVWRWHLEELPRFRAALPLGDRARLGTLGLVDAGLRRATNGGARHRGPARTLNRLAPLVQRQLGVDVAPRRLFHTAGGANGDGAWSEGAPEAPFERLFLVTSREGEGIEVLPVDPRLVASRMVASLQAEMAPLVARYREFRFAFPERACEVLERSAELQAELLAGAFRGKPALEVLHPYPVRLPELYRAMAPHVEAR